MTVSINLVLTHKLSFNLMNDKFVVRKPLVCEVYISSDLRHKAQTAAPQFYSREIRKSLEMCSFCSVSSSVMLSTIN